VKCVYRLTEGGDDKIFLYLSSKIRLDLMERRALILHRASASPKRRKHDGFPPRTVRTIIVSALAVIPLIAVVAILIDVSAAANIKWRQNAPQAAPVALIAPDRQDRVQGRSGSSEGAHWFRSTMTIERWHSPELLDSPEEIDLLGPASQLTAQVRRGTILKPD